MTFGFRSILVVNSEKNGNLFYVLIFSLCELHLQNRKSCRNTNFEGFFHFCSKWSPFSKMLVFNRDIKFS